MRHLLCLFCLFCCLFAFFVYISECKMYYNTLLLYVNTSMKVLHNHISLVLYILHYNVLLLITMPCVHITDILPTTCSVHHWTYEFSYYSLVPASNPKPHIPHPTCVYMHVLISVTRIAKLPDRPASLSIHFQHVAQHGRDCSPSVAAATAAPAAGPRGVVCMHV